MNEVDNKIKSQIERAKKILGIEISRDITAEELIAITTPLLEVTRMIREEDSK